MILVLGASGYIGDKVCQYLEYKKIPFRTFSLRFNLGKTEHLNKICRTEEISGIINCTAYTGTKSIDDCDVEIEKTQDANVYCVWNIIDVCKRFNIPLVHVSTGCIFDGDKNWDETVDPFFDVGVYNSTKIEAEKIVSSYSNTYICRLRLPFDFQDHPKNLLSKLIKFNIVGNSIQSITNINDFVLVCVELLQQKKPYGIYNVVNSGSVSMNKIKSVLAEFNMCQYGWTVLEPEREQELFKHKARATLSSDKIQREGFIFDSAEDSIIKCIKNWNLSQNPFWN